MILQLHPSRRRILKGREVIDGTTGAVKWSGKLPDQGQRRRRYDEGEENDLLGSFVSLEEGAGRLGGSGDVG